MPSIQGIELSADEVEIAMDMDLYDFIDFDDDEEDKEI